MRNSGDFDFSVEIQDMQGTMDKDERMCAGELKTAHVHV
jgi:hypothetical protein